MPCLYEGALNTRWRCDFNNEAFFQVERLLTLREREAFIQLMEMRQWLIRITDNGRVTYIVTKPHVNRRGIINIINQTISEANR